MWSADTHPMSRVPPPPPPRMEAHGVVVVKGKHTRVTEMSPTQLAAVLLQPLSRLRILNQSTMQTTHMCAHGCMYGCELTPPKGMHWKGERCPPTPSPGRPAYTQPLYPLTPSASFNGICNRQ